MNDVDAAQVAEYRFLLYVAGDAHNSLQAIANLDAICSTHLQGRTTIDVVDVFRDPARALSDGIFMTPTLIVSGPRAPRRIVGTLSDTAVVLRALGL